MYGTSGSSYSSTSGGSSSSSSSSSSSGGVSNSVITQSSAGGRVEMRCGAGIQGGDMVWYRQEGAGRRELTRNGQLISPPPRYHLSVSGGSSTLSIYPTQTADTGIFICESRSGGQTSTHTVQLNIGNGNGGNGGNGASARTAGAAAGFVGAMMMLM